MSDQGTSASDGAGGGDGDQQQPVAKTFTQAELDHEIGKRLSIEQRKFADYDELKSKAARFDELDAASKSELQKAQDANAKLAADNQWLGGVLYASQLDGAVVKAAIGKFANPNLAPKIVDASAIDLGDEKTIEAAVAKAIEENPELASNGRPTTPSFDGGARTPASGGADMNDLLRKAAGRA